jgi:hypothetical protein
MDGFFKHVVESLKKLVPGSTVEVVMPGTAQAAEDLAAKILADLKAGGATIVPLGKIEIGPQAPCNCKACRMRAAAPWN